MPLARFALACLIAITINGALSTRGETQQGCSCPEMVTLLPVQATLSRFSPRGRADLLQAILSNWNLVTAAEIKTPLRTQHFLTQLAVETGGFIRIDENLNYSADRILKVFPRRVTPGQSRMLAHNPIELANHVYGGRLGNTKPGDGWRYRGSGFMQLTGRENFRERGRMLKLPLEEQPELARTPGPGFSAAIAYWRAREINGAADRNDLVQVRRLVNGGTNGLAEARIWFARAKHYFPVITTEAVAQAEIPSPPEYKEEAPAASNKEELAAVQERLKELGFLSAPSEELVRPNELSSALKAFQESIGLPATGLYNEENSL